MGLADVLLVRRPPRPLEEAEASTDDEAAAELDDPADTCRPRTPQQEPSQMENKEPSQISYRMVEDLLAPYFSDSDDSDAGQMADSTRNANESEPSEAGAAVEDNQKAQKRRAAQKPLPPSVAAAVRRAIQRSSSLPGQLASTQRPRMHSCAAPWNTSAAAPLTRVGCSTGQRWPGETPEVALSSSSPLNAARRSSAVERRPVDAETLALRVDATVARAKLARPLAPPPGSLADRMASARARAKRLVAVRKAAAEAAATTVAAARAAAATAAPKGVLASATMEEEAKSNPVDETIAEKFDQGIPPEAGGGVTLSEAEEHMSPPEAGGGVTLSEAEEHMSPPEAEGALCLSEAEGEELKDDSSTRPSRVAVRVVVPAASSSASFRHRSARQRAEAVLDTAAVEAAVSRPPSRRSKQKLKSSQSTQQRRASSNSVAGE